jgi:hypothetical protein
MSLNSVRTRRIGRLLIVGAACALAGFAAGVLAVDSKPMIVTPFEDAQFKPLDPARPDGPQFAVLRGDPATGPSDMLLKVQQGPGRLHVHTADYHLVLLEGTMKHWGEAEKEADAKTLSPGSYWFQPGGQAHADSCLSAECLMFISWAGKRDARLAEGVGK